MDKAAPEGFGKYLEQLKDPEPVTRANARWQIGELLDRGMTLERAVLCKGQAAGEWVEGHTTAEGRLMAIRLLGCAAPSWQEDAARALLDIAGPQNTEVDQRAWAIYSLTFLGRKIPGKSPDLELLLEALNDPQAKVRQWAAFALGRLASPRSRQGTAAHLADREAHAAVEEALLKRWQCEVDTYVCRALVIAMGRAGGYVAPTAGHAGPAAELLLAAISKRYTDVGDELPGAVAGVAENVTRWSHLSEQDRVKILEALLQALHDWLKCEMCHYDAYRAAIQTLVGLVPQMLHRDAPHGEHLAVAGLRLLLDLAESPDYPIVDELREAVQERSIRALEGCKQQASKGKTGARLQPLLDQDVVPQLQLMLCRHSEDAAAQVRRTLTKLMGPVAAAKFYVDVVLEDGPAAAAARHHLAFLDKLPEGTVLRDEIFEKVRDGKMTPADALAGLEEKARQRAAQSLGGMGEEAPSDAFKRLDKALQSEAGPAYERATAALSRMGGSAATRALIAAARRTWVESKFFTPIATADEDGRKILGGTVWMSRVSWGFTLLVSLGVTAFGAWLLYTTADLIRVTESASLEALATGLGGVITVVVGLLTPFFWNSAAAVQKASADMTRLVTGFHGYMGRMRLLGLGFADLFSRKKADVEVLTTISSAAGDAMLDSAGVLSLVGAWPAGKGTVQVPDVAGKPWAKAAALARERGLEVTLKELADSDKDAGTISAQSPAAGSTVETGSTIELTVSKGPGAASQEVPPLVGKPWDEAQEAAAVASLVLKLADFVYDPKVGKGAIVSQEIPAGTKVAAQTAVDVTVSMGPQP